ncbi:hypothetical protein BWQ96_06035 [Gracilariopsis chorda]|uniref:Uncharacterized protein n=1 Tax=Gracilariopsis chorda TaxID=448386 RepID=A0A2V3IQ12_9FLOR|nr:hypothetical protein BWQ96_06035 [Gracilariopsis chorda]|eukprot:PXF44175.1 hypothetical protein BWQ96_06035 [Gracilariopsis chorda]
MKAASKNNGDTPPPSAQKPKRRAQPGDFERQVEHIRRDIGTIRSNLAAAEKALDNSGIPFDQSQEPHPENNEDSPLPQNQS